MPWQRKQLLKATGPLLVGFMVCAIVAISARSPLARQRPIPISAAQITDDSAVARVDRLMADGWNAAQIDPAVPADDLTLLRRLSLVLHGTVPSLEEIRLFESDNPADRVTRWTHRMLQDRRFADYFARRFARFLVGAEEGQFLVFRRDRFWAWLGDQFHANRPYDEIVREMIAGRGLWTENPEVNFVASVIADGVIDHNKLAGRTARAFLGQRFDCAQCHNHPFARWTQHQFEGLAACYSELNISPIGIEDHRDLKKNPYTVQDSKTLKDRPIVAEVPFHPEWMPADGPARQRLAAWVTHPENHRFDRALVNRVWGLMFGRPYALGPVDDLPDPVETGRNEQDLLDVLGADFRAHGCDFKRLIAMIAATRAFRLSSQHPAFDTGANMDAIEAAWAVFPITRLRPEQVIGSMVQASTVKTVDQNSHWTLRGLRFFKELDFVREYGDLGDDELTERSGTIPQALLRMNSEFAADWTKATPFSSIGRVAAMAPDDDACADVCFLISLTRHPTPEEHAMLRHQLEQTRGDERSAVVEDFFWAIFNGPEFCWEH